MAQENDVVLIYYEDQPLVFARIEEISPDFKRGWYIVKLLKWQVPLQVVSWILRDVYIDGSEFIMNGKRIRWERWSVRRTLWNRWTKRAPNRRRRRPSPRSFPWQT
ncbi:MAG: hypothetical protein ACQ9MH_20555 [Nitrospinales bacterium]